MEHVNDAEAIANEAGLRLGHYLLSRPMGRGGAGVVYEAVDLRDGSAAAVKVARDEKSWQREILRREIALLAGLRRGTPVDGVVELFAHGVEAGCIWYAMERVSGIDLGRLARMLRPGSGSPELQRSHTKITTLYDDDGVTYATASRAEDEHAARVASALALVEPRGEGAWNGDHPGANIPRVETIPGVLRLFHRMACTLAALHARAIVHGDLSPGNIIIRDDGTPLLVDFGTSFYSFVDGVAREAARAEGVAHGTPGYMAPEQLRGEPVDARCDLYALGCMLFELLAGRPPFVGEARAVQRLHLEAEVPPLATLAPGVPASVADVVARLLRKDPAQRLGFAEDVAAALAPWADARDTQRVVPAASGRRLYRSRLHGREQMLVHLEARLDDLRGGRGGTLLLAGESGVGKTRLLNEAGSIAARKNLRVLVGPCQSPSGGQGAQGPFEPLASALQAFRDLLHASRGHVPAEVAEAWSLLRPDAPVEGSREQLLGAMLTCLRTLGGDQPTLLLLDDLQWADDLTRAFVTWPPLKSLGTARVLLVGSYRDDDVEAELAAACKRVFDESLPLARLDRAGITALAHDMTASSTLPEGLVDDVFRASEGNPFFAAECLRTGFEEGVFQRDRDGHWHLSAPATAHAGYQTGERSLWRYLAPRLSRLGPTALRVAGLAAVLGRELETETLSSLPSVRETAGALEALEELIAQRVLEEPSPGRLRFAHELLRDACEQSLSPADRRAAHRSAALVLDELLARGPDLALEARLGRHWRGANEPARAAAVLERAARDFARGHAIGQASELYGQALAELEVVSQQTPAESGEALRLKRAELSEALGDLLALGARHAEARERYRQAADARPAADFLARARLRRKLARSLWTLHHYDEAAAELSGADALLRAGEGTLDEGERCRERIEVAQNRFWNGYFGRRLEGGGEELLAQIDRDTARFGTRRQRGIYEKCAAMLRMMQARFRATPAVIEHSRRSLALLEDDPSASDVVEARFSLAFALVTSTVDDCTEALALLDACTQAGERLGDNTNVARALAYKTVALRRLCRVEDTIAAAQATSRAAAEAQLLPYQGVASACLAWASWRTSERHGDEPSRRARGQVEEARQWWQRAGHPFPFRWLAELVAVALAADADDPAAAVEPLTVLARPDQFHLPERLDQAVEIARAACTAGDVEAGQRALRTLLLEAQRAGF